MRVFISGPITGHDDYKDAFEDAKRKIQEWGHEVINPADLDQMMPSKMQETHTDKTYHWNFIAPSVPPWTSLCPPRRPSGAVGSPEGSCAFPS